MSVVLRVLNGGSPMSVVDYVASDLFVVRIVKYLITNPDNKWVNSYELTAVADGGVTEIDALINTFVQFEQALHSELVAFDRIIVSTWAPDSVPYDPTAFLVSPLSVFGLRSSVPNEVEPLGMAWRVNRVPISGRVGNLFYRGALYENEVDSPAGTPKISVPADLALILSDAVTDTAMNEYLGGVTPTAFAMSMIDATGSIVRVVNSLVSDGVSLIKQDHQWFNRTP